jgi:cytochrome oxidase Cu insertion factor (SCO1/SenC/PrrC family)
MKPANPSPKTLVILLAAVSLGTTALILINVANRRGPDAAIVGGAIAPTGQLDPPVLVELPPFDLTERSGQPVKLADLTGKTLITAFIFTHCEGPCPMMTSRMAELQKQLASHPRWSDIRLVSISVDPVRDTPERLTEYATWAHADPQQWLFLTGERAYVWDLVRNGFKLPIGETDNPQMPIFHSQKFLLIDGQGRIRGLYDGLEEEGRQKLLADLDKLLAATP